MAELYFSSCFVKHPSHKNYQQIIRERDNAVKYAEKLRNELKCNIEQFNLQYTAFQHQLDELSQRIKELEQQNKAKDQLLNGNSKVIMEKTTDIIKLKDEIDELKEELSHKEGENFIASSETNLQNASHLSPFSIHKAYSDHVSNNYHHNNVRRSRYHLKSQSDSTALCFMNKIRKKQPTKPLPSITSKPSEPNINEMPFIHRKSSTQTSSLSEAAVNLQFPGSNSPTSPIQIPGTTLIANVKPLQLSPICETKSRDDETSKKKRINLIKISDDNSNIVKEWGQSIADYEEQSDIEQKITNAPTLRITSRSNEFASIEPYDNLKDEKDIDQMSDNSSEISVTEYLNVRKQSDNISYCSDNTIMLNDINMEMPAADNIKRINYVNMDVLPARQHFTKKSNGNLNVNECDIIIESPVKVYLNHSFKIVVNDD